MELCTDVNCKTCRQDDPKTWTHNSYQISYTDQSCPICGTWGIHNCLGYRYQAVPPTVTVTTPIDWNRAINILDRLVTVLEKYLEEK